TLRAVGGLTPAEIANAFLIPEATMAQRIGEVASKIDSGFGYLIDLLDVLGTQSFINLGPVLQGLCRAGVWAWRWLHFGNANDQALIGRKLPADHLLKRAAVRIVECSNVDFQIGFHGVIIPRR